MFSDSNNFSWDQLSSFPLPRFFMENYLKEWFLNRFDMGHLIVTFNYFCTGVINVNWPSEINFQIIWQL